MKFKNFLSFVLAIILVFGISSFAFAQENDVFKEGTLKIVDFNVDGLPVPASLSKDNKSPYSSAKSIIGFLNGFDADIINMQENFNYYFMYKNGLNADYISEYNGGVAVGDGLVGASKHKIYNVKHIAWDTACGVLDRGSDELTPKGFMVYTIEVADGVLIDVYNLHADACEDEGSLQAKRDQFDQLMTFIDEYSKDKGVIISGDFNSNYTIVLGEVLREKFVDNGFKDTWIETNNDGNYSPTYSELYNKYQVPYSGNYDCLDKIYYRNGSNIEFEAINHEYIFCNTENKDGVEVLASDHSACVSEISYKVTEKNADTTELIPEKAEGIIVFLKRVLDSFKKALALVIKEVPGLISGEIKIGWMK